MTNSSYLIIEDNLSLMAKGQYQRVHTNAINLIHQNVDDAAPYFLLAKLCFDHKNYTKCRELFEKSLSLNPTHPYSLTYFSQVLVHIGDHAEAKNIVEKAAKQPPENAHLSDTIGVVYSRLGMHEKAIDWFQHAVEFDSSPANFHYNLGASQQFLGDFDKAESAYLGCLKRDPSNYKALTSLVGLKKQTPQDNELDTLLNSFEKMKDDADARLHIGHALAKTYEDFGDYPASFQWLNKAKSAKCQSSPSFEYETIFSVAKQLTKQVNQLAGNNPPNLASPIFVVGLPRTGTTLVDRILSSHHDVDSGGELNIFAELIKQATASPSNFVLDAETLALAGTIDFREIGEQYIHATRSLLKDTQRSVDKMPLNFFYAGLILKALPNARVVALRRGAMDSCLSNYRQLLTTQHAYYDYTYSLDSTAKFYRLFDDLMAHWRAELPKNRFMEIQYEDIVNDQEAQTRRLLSFCELDWDESCLRFHENSAPVSTASSVQVRQPLYSGSIGRWKRYGSLVDNLKDSLGTLAT